MGPTIAWAVARKDLLLDLRSRDRLAHMMLFSAIVSILLSIALPQITKSLARWVPALVWVVFLLSSILGLSRSFQAEVEGGALQQLVCVPCQRGWVFLGKAFANWVTLVALQVFTAILFGVFLRVPWSAGYPTEANPAGGGVDLMELFGIAVVGAAGLSVLGTLFAGVATAVRNREFMLPLLLFPLALPILVFASRATLEALSSEPVRGLFWSLMLTYTWVFLVLGFFVFDYVLED